MAGLVHGAAGSTGHAQTVEALRPGPWHAATGITDALADAGSVPVAVHGSLALGDLDRAGTLLLRYGDRLDAAGRLALAAAVAAARTEWGPAALTFAAAALMRSDRDRGLLEVRAGQAFEAAAQFDSAAAAYGRARQRLPELAGWLALREAAVIDHLGRAESLLAVAPVLARPLALRTRARIHLLLGEPDTAEVLLGAAGLAGRAATLALARHDTAAALRFASQAVGGPDTVDVRRGVVLFQETLVPPTAAVALAVARGAARLGATRQAATWGLQAIALGDTTPATLLTIGGWLEASGQHRAALEPYARAGQEGAVSHARVRLRLGDRAAITTLRRFATDHPGDPSAPAALTLAADALSSDSLLAEVARRWPRHTAASRARMRLALRRLAAGDSVGALPFLDGEIVQRGASEHRARFLRARVAGTRRRPGDAQTDYAALAAADSLGYYGLLARRAAGLPDPVMAAPPARTPDPGVTAELRQLALLDALGLAEEADLLVRDFLERDWGNLDALLDAADGLVELGRANQAIRLGFLAARRHTLHDPRVVRAVFPWPNRDLVVAEAREFGLDPYLVAGLIRQESWFLPTARSRAGAMGYMQLMPATAKEVARRGRLTWFDAMLTMADANLHLGCAHLAGLLRTFEGDTVPALAAYNAGGTPVRRWRRIRGADDPVVFVERITYAETQGYVQAVVRNAALYRWLYGEGHADGGA